MDDTCKLVSKTFSSDEIGQRIPSETLTEIFVSVSSASRSEFYNAGQNGIRPEFVLTTPAVNYNGEDEVEYKNARYKVYRSYVNGEKAELYLQKAN